MSKEESTKILNFMIPGAGDLMLRRGHISHTVKKCIVALKIFSSVTKHKLDKLS